MIELLGFAVGGLLTGVVLWATFRWKRTRR